MAAEARKESFREVFRILKDWRRFMPADLGNKDNEREFIQEKAAMTWDTSIFVQKLMRDPSRTFEWGMFYLPPITKATSRYAGGYPQCIIGEAASSLRFQVCDCASSTTTLRHVGLVAASIVNERRSRVRRSSR